MHTRTLVRTLILSLIAVVTFSGGANVALANEPGSREFSITSDYEQTFVQACDGFDAVTSYTVTRDYYLVTDHTGELVFERRHVRFVGAVANAETSLSFLYDGGFTRVADYEAGTIAITDLALRVDLPSGEPIAVGIDHRDYDLTDNSGSLLRELAAWTPGAGLCEQLGGFPTDDTGSPGPVDLCGPRFTAFPC